MFDIHASVGLVLWSCCNLCANLTEDGDLIHLKVNVFCTIFWHLMVYLLCYQKYLLYLLSVGIDMYSPNLSVRRGQTLLSLHAYNSFISL